MLLVQHAEKRMHSTLWPTEFTTPLPMLLSHYTEIWMVRLLRLFNVWSQCARHLGLQYLCENSYISFFKVFDLPGSFLSVFHSFASPVSCSCCSFWSSSSIGHNQQHTETGISNLRISISLTWFIIINYLFFPLTDVFVFQLNCTNCRSY